MWVALRGYVNIDMNHKACFVDKIQDQIIQCLTIKKFLRPQQSLDQLKNAGKPRKAVFFSLQCMLRSSPNVKSEQKYQLCFFCTFALITQDETTSVNPSIHIFIAGYDYPPPLPPLGSSQVVLTTSHVWVALTSLSKRVLLHDLSYWNEFFLHLHCPANQLHFYMISWAPWLVLR